MTVSSMKLERSLWSDFKTFLNFDLKLSDKPGAVYSNRSCFNKLADYFHDKEFTRDNFNIFIGELKSKNYAGSYINKFITMAKNIGHWKKINDFADYTYFDVAKKVNYDILTPEEITKLAEVRIEYSKFNNYINKRQKALIYLLGTTGCRIGEALGLKFSDIYSTASIYYVIFRDTKNNDDRSVPVSKDVYEMLIDLKRINEFVFTSGRGISFKNQQVNEDLKTRANKVGIKKRVWCHLFRHSYITTMLEQGADSLDVAMIVGHKDPKNTMRYKNSLISHYYDIARLHPLLRKSLTWEERVEKIKEYINKNIDTKVDNLQIKENKKSLLILINKGEY